MWQIRPCPIIRRATGALDSIFLTFDDGPSADFTPRILDALGAEGVHATFFVLGSACEQHPELARRILAEGHDLGCHTYSHKHPWNLDGKLARQEVRRGFFAIANITGACPRLFRPPFGRINPVMIKEARQLGMRTVLWNRSAIDWGRWGQAHLVKRRLEKVTPGDIILMHDSPRTANHPEVTATVLPDFLRSWQQSSLHCRPVSVLL